MSNSVLISVIMSVYNTREEWLREAIESILNQSFSNFEFIIILDCPTDNSRSIVYEYAKSDNRIRIIENEKNMGLTANLNKAMLLSNGKYIARMDSDDIAMPERLMQEFKYMESNLDVAVVGSKALAFTESGEIKVIGSQLTESRELNRIKMLFFNAGIVHPTAFIRKSFVTEKKINYDLGMKKSQDYSLWLDVMENSGVIEEIDRPLLRYRIHSNQITQKDSAEQIRCVQKAMSKRLFEMKLNYDERQLGIHYSLYVFNGEYKVQEYDEYIDYIINANKDTKKYDPVLFKKYLLKLWFHDIGKAVIKYKKISFLKSKYLLKAVLNSILKLD